MIAKSEIKETRYSDKIIVNPIAVPDPSAAEGNYSWMYLITPYYNKLVKDFNEQQQENSVLKQHFDYYAQMQQEKELLQEQFECLQKSEKQLMDRISGVNEENQVLEGNVQSLENNLIQVLPEKTKEANAKMENLNAILQSKDGAIEQLLSEIANVKNQKDDLQNELLFKKQRIDNLNIDFNTKE